MQTNNKKKSNFIEIKEKAIKKMKIKMIANTIELKCLFKQDL